MVEIFISSKKNGQTLVLKGLSPSIDEGCKGSIRFFDAVTAFQMDFKLEALFF